MTGISPLKNLRRVYCAGPLFCQAERQEMEQIAGLLRREGFEPFLPHADGMEFARVLPSLERRGFSLEQSGRLLHEAIFALDTYQVIVDCGSLVFNMNGRVPDEGAVAEMTMAWMLGKPLVLYKDDVRSTIAGRDNPLIVGQARFATVERIEELPRRLAEQIADLTLAVDWSVDCPPHVAQTVKTGEQLWRQIGPLDAKADVERIADIVLDLVGDKTPLRG
ncbi:MAG: nucleoside 2-deoxyribosyltransferase [Planctomycetes bacterium]|nr:nucleoside 2-deoxyribosyltransferase [Planctomycetota bacterium]